MHLSEPPDDPTVEEMATRQADSGSVPARGMELSRVVLVDDPAPRLTIVGPDGSEADVTMSVERLVFDMAAGEPHAVASLVLRVDSAGIDFLAAVEVSGSSAPVEVTAEMIDEAWGAAGLPSPPGSAVCSFLKGLSPKFDPLGARELDSVWAAAGLSDSLGTVMVRHLRLQGLLAASSES